jgi:ABC-2 type transport system permease protein
MFNRRGLRSLYALTVASMKMYFRNRSAVFFTLFLPLAFIGIFGLLSKSNTSRFTIAVTNLSQTEVSRGVVTSLKQVKAFEVKEMPADAATEQLAGNDVDLKVTIPKEFGTTDAEGKLQPARITSEYNEARPQNGSAASLILAQVVDGLNDQITGAPTVVSVEGKGVKTSNLGAIDFLLPGILAISIMQLGIFSVAFAFVSMKASGMLRRLQATPTHPGQFVAGQAITRLVIGILQVILLTFLGIWLFEFHMLGNLIEFLAVAVLGTLVFLAFGFIVAGLAKDENQAAPIANLIAFPMMFLSGTFFERDNFPAAVKTITDFFPLTYLADALRQIANEGAHLADITHDLLGLIVWGIILFIGAVKAFRWE